MHELYLPLVRLAKLNIPGISLEGLIKKARGSMDLLMLTDFVGAATGSEPENFRRMVLRGPGVTGEVLEALEYLKNPRGEKPSFYKYLEESDALVYLPYFEPGMGLGLYNAAYGGASNGLSKMWLPEYSSMVPGVRGASPDDVVQAMVFGGLPLPGDIWDNTQKKYKPRPPLFPVGDNIMIRLGKNKYSSLNGIKGALSKAAERTALKWVMSVDEGYKANFLTEEAIPEVYEEVDPLSPEELLEFSGWFDLVIPKARFLLRNSEGQLRLFEAIVSMRDSGRDPLIYKGGQNPDVGLKINEVIKWMEDKGMFGASGNVPSPPRIAKAWKGVKEAILNGFEEAFSVVQQELIEQEKAQMDRAMKKHDIKDIIDSRKTMRTQILEDIIEEQSRRRKRADFNGRLKVLTDKLASSMSLPQPKRASVANKLTAEISELNKRILSL